MGLSEERKARLLAYCKLTELADDPEVMMTVEDAYGGAVDYMTRAGVSEPPKESPRRASYDLCVNRLVLEELDLRGMTVVGVTQSENLAFRRRLNQLKFTEGVVPNE